MQRNISVCRKWRILVRDVMSGGLKMTAELKFSSLLLWDLIWQIYRTSKTQKVLLFSGEQMPLFFVLMPSETWSHLQS